MFIDHVKQFAHTQYLQQLLQTCTNFTLQRINMKHNQRHYILPTPPATPPPTDIFQCGNWWSILSVASISISSYICPFQCYVKHLQAFPVNEQSRFEAIVFLNACYRCFCTQPLYINIELHLLFPVICEAFTSFSIQPFTPLNAIHLYPFPHTQLPFQAIISIPALLSIPIHIDY